MRAQVARSMRSYSKFVLVVLSIFSNALFCGRARSADHVVLMTSSWHFSPSYLEIDVGDTVTWRNRDDFDDHDATSTALAWSTGLVAPDESATLLFSAPGTFPYADSLYGPAGMTGTLVVKGGTTPQPSAGTLTNFLTLADGSFRFTITNVTPNLPTVVEISTNLTEWIALTTNYPASDSFDFTNFAAVIIPRSFYRCYQSQ